MKRFDIIADNLVVDTITAKDKTEALQEAEMRRKTVTYRYEYFKILKHNPDNIKFYARKCN